MKRWQIFLITVVFVLNLYIVYSLTSFSSSIAEQYDKKFSQPENLRVEIIKKPLADVMFDYNEHITQIDDLSLVSNTVTLRNPSPNSKVNIEFFNIELQGFQFKFTLNSFKNIEDDKNIIGDVKGPILKENNVRAYEIHFKKIEIPPNGNIELQMDYQLSVPKRQYSFVGNNSKFLSPYPFDGYTVWVPIFYKPALNSEGQDFSPQNTLDGIIKFQEGFILDEKNSGIYGLEIGIADYIEKKNKEGKITNSSWLSMLNEYSIDPGIYHQESNILTVHGSDLSNLPFPRLKFTLERPIFSKILFYITLIISTIVCWIFIKNEVQFQNINTNDGKIKSLQLFLSLIPAIFTFYNLNHPSTLTILDLVSLEPILILILLSFIDKINKLVHNF